MAILVYIRLVFCTAWGHSASLARTIIFYVLVITGVAILLVPIVGMTLDAAGLPSLLSNPKSYAVLFGAIVLSRLLCAPYWIWQRDQKEIAALTATKLCKKSVAEVTAIIDALEKAHAAGVALMADTMPDSDYHFHARTAWTMDTMHMMKQLDMPKHEIFCFQNPTGLPDQEKCLRERQQLLRSLIEQYMRGKQCQTGK